ncbi:hypothetical protein Patl1_17979 [Pistacia atlantica]|uniref:Uncharacterized protein n=1 Tax=Pistacia atlantica TaxID=434234 RepID=A0ACC1C2W0_9ROSI|nr:hypothetical protein Patl1_17979 [Pistacia atlantica]
MFSQLLLWQDVAMKFMPRSSETGKDWQLKVKDCACLGVFFICLATIFRPFIDFCLIVRISRTNML